jgi:Mitochondrial carrier protein
MVPKSDCDSGGSQYNGPLSCAADLVRREGPRALLKGWTIQYVRLGPQTVVTFLVLEQVRPKVGLESF